MMGTNGTKCKLITQRGGLQPAVAPRQAATCYWSSADGGSMGFMERALALESGLRVTLELPRPLRGLEQVSRGVKTP